MPKRTSTPDTRGSAAARRRFPPGVLEALGRARILGVRAGAKHRYTGVWVVVVAGRVFARTWNDDPTGWFRAFRAEAQGSIRCGRREVAVRARFVRGVRLREAISAAYARKYDTRGARQWVRGLALPERSANTVEFTPEC